MKNYEPSVAPNPEEWLSIEESERIELVRAFHKRAKEFTGSSEIRDKARYFSFLLG